MIQVKKIIYTPANIYAMFATPQIVLAAPPAGYANNILGISHHLIFNTLAYTVATVFTYAKTTNPTYYYATEVVTLPSVNSINTTLLRNLASATPFTTVEDFKVTTNAAAATGDSNINAYIIYETKLIDT